MRLSGGWGLVPEIQVPRANGPGPNAVVPGPFQNFVTSALFFYKLAKKECGEGGEVVLSVSPEAPSRAVQTAQQWVKALPLLQFSKQIWKEYI